MKILYRIIICILIIIAVGIGTVIIFSNKINYAILVSDYHNGYVQVDYIYDVTTLESIVGYSDYVFVGLVKDYKGNISNTNSGLPDSIYSIEVIKNIKGSLILNTEIELIKSGGISGFPFHKSTIAGDIMPKKEGYYIFSVVARSSGKITAGTPNSTVKIENIDNYQEDIQYTNFVNAYANQVIYTRERYKSTYDNE